MDGHEHNASEVYIGPSKGYLPDVLIDLENRLRKALDRIAALEGQEENLATQAPAAQPAPKRRGKWVIWSQDARTGTWLQVNEGPRQAMENHAARTSAAAAKHGISARYVACPEGTDPASVAGD